MPAQQSFQTLELGDMFSTQSMMYDQVLSNLSASLSGASGGSAGASAGAFAQQQQQGQGQQQQAQPADGQMVSDNFTDLLASFGGDYGAIFPEFSDGALNFSTWDSVPQGFGCVVFAVYRH